MDLDTRYTRYRYCHVIAGNKLTVFLVTKNGRSSSEDDNAAGSMRTQKDSMSEADTVMYLILLLPCNCNNEYFLINIIPIHLGTYFIGGDGHSQKTSFGII